jgi:hypothetical protein
VLAVPIFSVISTSIHNTNATTDTACLKMKVPASIFFFLIVFAYDAIPKKGGVCIDLVVGALRKTMPYSLSNSPATIVGLRTNV